MKRKLSLILLFVFLGFVTACTTADNKVDKAGTITIVVVDYEQKELVNESIEFKEEDTLLKIIQDHKTIKAKGNESEFGFFIVEMCGVSSEDYEKTFWAVYVNGESSLVGVSEIKLVDKQKIEFKLIGW